MDSELVKRITKFEDERFPCHTMDKEATSKLRECGTQTLNLTESSTSTDSPVLPAQRRTKPANRRLVGCQTKLQSEQECRNLAERRIRELHREVDGLKLTSQQQTLEHEKAIEERETAHVQLVETLGLDHQRLSEKREKDHLQLVEGMERDHEKLTHDLATERELFQKQKNDHERAIKKMEATHDQLTEEAKSQRDLLESKEQYHQQRIQKMLTRCKEVIQKKISDHQSAERQTRKRHRDVVQELRARLEKDKEQNGQATQYMLSRFQIKCQETIDMRKYYQDLTESLTSERDVALQRLSHFKTVAEDTIVEAKAYITMNHVIFDYQPDLARQKTMLELMLPTGSRIIGRMREGRNRWRELHQGGSKEGPDFEAQRKSLLDEFKGLPLCDEAIFMAHRETLQRFRGIESGNILQDVEKREQKKLGGRYLPNDLQRFAETVTGTNDPCEPAQEVNEAAIHADAKHMCSDSANDSLVNDLVDQETKRAPSSGTDAHTVHMWQLRPQKITSDTNTCREPEEEEDTDVDESDSDDTKKRRRSSNSTSSENVSFQLRPGRERRVKTDSPMQAGRTAYAARTTASPRSGPGLGVHPSEEQRDSWQCLLSKFRYGRGGEASPKGSGKVKSQRQHKRLKRGRTAE